MKREPTGKVIRDYGLTVGLAVVVALTVRIFILEAYRIPTPVMRPTLEPGDTIFVSKVRFNIRTPWSSEPMPHGPAPKHGEVVLYTPPGDTVRDSIKRIVGVPGDLVQLRRGRLIVNHKPLAYDLPSPTSPCGTERWPDGLKYQVCWEPPILEDYGPEKVPDGSVFVLGDLRSRGGGTEPAGGSSISASAPLPGQTTARTWGIVPDSSLKGKALWIWMSIEPRGLGESADWFPRFRFPRMFRRIE